MQYNSNIMMRDYIPNKQSEEDVMRKSILSGVTPLLCMAAASEAGASGAPATGEGQPAAGGEVKAPAVPAEIIRGRMPVAVVFLVRFGDQRNGTTKELATLFGTTVGKIDDLKKNRNFTYVKSDFAPTAEQKAEGIAWLQRHPKFNDGAVDKLINELEAIPAATAEQVAAFAAAKGEARGTNTTTKDGAPVTDAGGGNRRGKKAKGAPAETAAAEPAKAEDLLS